MLGGSLCAHSKSVSVSVFRELVIDFTHRNGLCVERKW